MRFPIRFDPPFRALAAALLLTPSRSFIEVDGDDVRVRMAWGFRARFPKSAVVSVTEYHRRPLSRGVHGWAGRWLLNGSGEDIVNITLVPAQRAYVMGFPVLLRNLLISVEDPEGVKESLSP